MGRSASRTLNPGAGGSDFDDFTAFKGEVFFGGTDDNHGQELWRSDGTKQGTKRVRDINNGPDGSGTEDFAQLGNRLYFYASDDKGGELWRTDGTKKGTKRVKNIAPGSDSSSPADLTVLADAIFFAADDGERRL